MNETTELITEPVEFDERLREELASFGDQVEIVVESEEPSLMSSIKRVLTARFEELDTNGTETILDHGRIVSFEGNFAFAATCILLRSQQFGVPTLVYTDEHISESPFEEEYQDVTAGWYSEWAKQLGIPETRMEVRGDSFDHELIEFDELTHWAAAWLARR